MKIWPCSKKNIFFSIKLFWLWTPISYSWGWIKTKGINNNDVLAVHCYTHLLSGCWVGCKIKLLLNSDICSSILTLQNHRTAIDQLPVISTFWYNLNPSSTFELLIQTCGAQWNFLSNHMTVSKGTCTFIRPIVFWHEMWMNMILCKTKGTSTFMRPIVFLHAIWMNMITRGHIHLCAW